MSHRTLSFVCPSPRPEAVARRGRCASVPARRERVGALRVPHRVLGRGSQHRIAWPWRNQSGARPSSYLRRLRMQQGPEHERDRPVRSVDDPPSSASTDAAAERTLLTRLWEWLHRLWYGLRAFMADPVRLSIPKPVAIVLGTIVAVLIALLVPFTPDMKIESRIREKVALFDFVLTDVVRSYVDPVDVDKLFDAGVDGMLGTLDPYTQFEGNIAAREMKLKTSGQYGGVGLGIAQSVKHPDETLVVNAFEGYAFDRGVRVGDVIEQVEGASVRGMPLDKITELLRGEPGTIVRVRLSRESTAAPDGRRSFEVALPRRLVRIRDVPLYGYISGDDGIGYIRLQSFASQAGREVRLAIDSMLHNGELKTLVLDLRSNPGGLLDAAVETAEALVPKGSAVVSTKGRALGETIYVSDEEPALPADVRLVVLANEATASAAEIVAGAVQDLDRGVIVGARTFGKGLVQNVESLPFNTALKYTVGKYYTPSGRCIQSVTYSEASASLPGADGAGRFTDPAGNMLPALPPAGGPPRFSSNKVQETERREFRTLHGRTVRDGGGIEPDVASAPPKPSELEASLIDEGKFFFFANRYASQHTSLSEDFQVDDALYKQFQDYVTQDTAGMKLTTRFEPGFKLFETVLDEAGYREARKAVERVRDLLIEEMRRDFGRHADSIRQRLEDAIRQRFEPESKRLSAALRHDTVLRDALKLVREDSARGYLKLLEPATSSPSMEPAAPALTDASASGAAALSPASVPVPSP